MSKYGAPIWEIVLEAVRGLDKEVFQPKDVIDRVHQEQPEIPATTIRTYVIAMAPDHPSSIHYSSTRKNHPYFDYLGAGKFRLKFTLTPVKPEKPRLVDPVEDFKDKYGEVIRLWAEEHFDELVEGRRRYSWRDKPTIECLRERNAVQAAIVKSRIDNAGGVDLRTLDMVMDWGRLNRFQLEEDKALRVTREAFKLLDCGDVRGAVRALLGIYGVGISSASKVLGLFDQSRFAIYDSRVGSALRSLLYEGKRLVKCPAGRGRSGDACSDEVWAKNYERLIWVLEVVRDYMNERGYPLSVGDVEMALFMIGK